MPRSSCPAGELSDTKRAELAGILRDLTGLLLATLPNGAYAHDRHR